MEARFAWAVPASALLFCLCFSSLGPLANAAGYKTTNFVVSAPTPQLAKEIGDQAEVYRKQLAVEWLGKELPAWSIAKTCHTGLAPSPGSANVPIRRNGTVLA